MAVVLRNFPASASVGRPQKYPWEQWQDGRVWKARQGVDFSLTPARFRCILYQRANSYGRTCRTRIDGEYVTFQFQDRE